MTNKNKQTSFELTVMASSKIASIKKLVALNQPAIINRIIEESDPQHVASICQDLVREKQKQSELALRKAANLSKIRALSNEAIEKIAHDL